MRCSLSLLAAAHVVVLLPAGSRGAPLVPASEARTLKGHAAAVTSVAFSPARGMLASASADATVKLWDLKTGQLRLTLTGHVGPVACVGFSPDGKTLASGGADRDVKVWDVVTGKLRTTLSAHTGKVKCLAFSSKGDYLATGSDDTTIRLWNVEKGELAATLRGHARGVLSLAFAPSRDILASGSGDQSVKLWSLQRRTERTPPGLAERGKHGPVVSVAFSSDGFELALSTPNFVAIWDMTHADRRFALKGRRNGSITSARYSPHGRLLAAACGARDPRPNDGHGKNTPTGAPRQLRQNEIRLWDTATGRECGSLNGHCGPVRTLDFSPDGKLLATGSDDQTVMVWDVARYQDAATPPPDELAASTAGNATALRDDESSSEVTAVTCDQDESLIDLEFAGAIALPPRPKGKNRGKGAGKGSTRAAGVTAYTHDRPPADAAQSFHRESYAPNTAWFNSRGESGSKGGSHGWWKSDDDDDGKGGKESGRRK